MPIIFSERPMDFHVTSCIFCIPGCVPWTFQGDATRCKVTNCSHKGATLQRIPIFSLYCIIHCICGFPKVVLPPNQTIHFFRWDFPVSKNHPASYWGTPFMETSIEYYKILFPCFHDSDVSPWTSRRYHDIPPSIPRSSQVIWGTSSHHPLWQNPK